MQIAVIICAIIVVFMTIVNVVTYWQINKLLKEFKETAEVLENDK